MSVFTVPAYKKASKMRTNTRTFAVNMDEQCSIVHLHGKGKSRYRCQWKALHDGKHIDYMGREWK